MICPECEESALDPDGECPECGFCVDDEEEEEDDDGDTEDEGQTLW